MARSKSSHRWLKEHFSDQYVLRSQKEGYRSRACYKLIELDDKYALLKGARTIVDLGAAPGSWTQVVAERAGDGVRIIASDILPMDTLAGVTFVQGDFGEDEIYEKLLALIGEPGADLVISDMAPNLSGVKSVDQARTMVLVELAFDLAGRVLRPGGAFVTKVFHGEGFDEFVRMSRERFDAVRVHKPDASRSRSPEVYLVATGFRGGDTAL